MGSPPSRCQSPKQSPEQAGYRVTTWRPTLLGIIAPDFNRYSYAPSWEAYITGHIVSEFALRYIENLLAATAATKTEDSEDSSDDSDAELFAMFDYKAGSMQLVGDTCYKLSVI